MAAFKQRGILVLGIILVLALLVVDVIKVQFGWQTNILGNALIVGGLGLIIAIVLRRYGFYPFARRSDR
jgi:hypothetical protein